MPQTPEGAAKVRAQRAGMTLAALREREVLEKRCWACAEWRPRTSFNIDRSRYDGLSAKCQSCSRVKVRVCTKGRPSAMKGKRFSDAARANMGAPKGRPNPRKGVPRSVETKAKISRTLRSSPSVKRGAAAHTYVDGRMAERANERLTSAYKRWRFDVYVRDGFACQDGPEGCSKRLNAHHIKPFATHPGLRLDVSNGVTLCQSHHRKRHAG